MSIIGYTVYYVVILRSNFIFLGSRMAKTRKSWDQKICTGTYHWSDCTDWRIYKYESIFDIPVSTLESYGWSQLEFGLVLEIPIQKYEVDYSYSTKGGFNHGVYQMLQIDWQYLLERQAYQFASLYWEPDTIQGFFDQFGSWMIERAQYYREKDIRNKATEIAKTTGMSVEDILTILKAQSSTSITQTEDEPEEVIELEPELKDEEDNLPVGTLEKLGNEFFIYASQSNERYKIKDKNLIPGNPKELVGKDFRFTYDPNNPPKSRNAKGWVLTINQI